MKRKAALLTSAEHFEIVEEEIPKLQSDEILVRVVSVGLCHTDLPGYYGSLLFRPDRFGNLHAEKKVNFPLRPGHEPIGIVEDVGSNVKNLKAGDKVGGYMPNAFASYLIGDSKGLAKLPDDIRNFKYCLVEPLMCVANIVKVANPLFGEYIGIVGCGMMGLMTIAALRKSGAREIVAVDLVDERLEWARKFGATLTINPQRDDLEKIVHDMTDNRFLDVVVEITGSLKGLKTAASIIRTSEFYGHRGRGRILIPSFYGKAEEWDPQMGYHIMQRSVVLQSVHPWFSEDLILDMENAVWAYTNGFMPLDEIITHEWPLEQISLAFQKMTSGDKDYIKGIITF
jgi:threonine dehydrogenase-like Zn-dependent dehydrogenase